jgi:hypothetical protein
MVLVGRGSSPWRQQWRVAVGNADSVGSGQGSGTRGVLPLLSAVDASLGKEQHAGGVPESRSASMPRSSGEDGYVGAGARVT